jgi:hypothetical protein
MAEKTSWINDALQLVKERKGAVTAEDEQNLREAMKIPNDDISVEEVEFKRYRSYL